MRIASQPALRERPIRVNQVHGETRVKSSELKEATVLAVIAQTKGMDQDTFFKKILPHIQSARAKRIAQLLYARPTRQTSDEKDWVAYKAILLWARSNRRKKTKE